MIDAVGAVLEAHGRRFGGDRENLARAVCFAPVDIDAEGHRDRAPGRAQIGRRKGGARRAVRDAENGLGVFIRGCETWRELLVMSRTRGGW